MGLLTAKTLQAFFVHPGSHIPLIINVLNTEVFHALGADFTSVRHTNWHATPDARPYWTHLSACASRCCAAS